MIPNNLLKRLCYEQIHQAFIPLKKITNDRKELGLAFHGIYFHFFKKKMPFNILAFIFFVEWAREFSFLLPISMQKLACVCVYVCVCVCVCV